MALMSVATDLVGMIREAITDRLDGNVAIALSGGLDSSTVAALAPPHLPTFTGWYDEPGFDERRYADLVAHQDHREVEITARAFVEHFDSMVRHIREPLQGPGTMGQYLVAREMLRTKGIDAALSGEGSDELFGGYARTLIAAGEPVPDGYENYKPPSDYPANLHDALQYDLDRLPDLLAVDDQMAGAFGIEARAPFTDDRIREYALALPDEERVGKRHLRQRVRGIVPTEIVDRTDKMGFPAPWVRWSQEEPLRGFLSDRLGYLPDPDKPFGRGWWYALVRDGMKRAAGG